MVIHYSPQQQLHTRTCTEEAGLPTVYQRLLHFPRRVTEACDSYRLPMTSASIADNCTGSDAKVAQ